MTHTPGPWSIQPSSNPKNGTTWRDIVSLGQEFSPSYVGEALERDAHLIAAAPEMLAALHSVLETLFYFREKQRQENPNIPEDDIIGIGDIRHIQKIILKAEGKG